MKLLCALGFAAMVATMVAGCSHTMALPPGFVQLGSCDARGDYLVRGISADKAVVALEQHPNPKNGTLEFWVHAMKDEMKTGRGYELSNEENVTSQSGQTGHMMTFKQESQDMRYVVCVYVDWQTVLVAQAGGKTAAIEPRMNDIRQAMLSAR
jgi:hypothetical protein